MKRWTVPRCCSFVGERVEGYGYATGDGLGVDGELILERRRQCDGWRCCDVVSLKEDEMGASD